MTFTDEESIIADILAGIDTVPEMLDRHVPLKTDYKYFRERYGAILRDRIRKSEVIIEIGMKKYPYTNRMVKRYGLTEKSRKVNESQIDFLPCPFCGGSPKLETDPHKRDFCGDRYRIACKSCYAGTRWYYSPDEAWLMWNGRVKK